MSSVLGFAKRNAYDHDFKIKVLEHYIKNGGDKVFGLKARTAQHFEIGKKTVCRIVENRDHLLAEKARRSKKAIPPAVKAALESIQKTSSSKASAGVKTKTLSPASSSLSSKSKSSTSLKSSNSSKSVSKSSTESSSRSTANKPASNVNKQTSNVNKQNLNVNKPASNVNKPTSNVCKPTSTVNKPASANKPSATVNKPSPTANKPSSSANKPSPIAASTPIQNVSTSKVTQNVSTKSAAPSKATSAPVTMAAESAKLEPSLTGRPETRAQSSVHSSRRGTPSRDTPDVQEHEEVLDLPEDPDYSVLKLPIAGGVTATGVLGPAMLLSKATEEDQTSQLTPHTHSVVTELPPRCSSRRLTTRQRASLLKSSAAAAANKPSSNYYAKLEEVERRRRGHSKDVSISLQGIDGVEGVVYQNFAEGDHADASVLQDDRDTVMDESEGITAIIDEEGRVTASVGPGESLPEVLEKLEQEEQERKLTARQRSLKLRHEKQKEQEAAAAIIISTESEGEDDEEEMVEVNASDKEEEEDDEEGSDNEGNSTANKTVDGEFVCVDCARSFSSSKCLRAHFKNVHGPERTVFSCPICDKKFLSVWTVSKHLQKRHKKTRSQIDHLRNLIKKNSYKQANVVVAGKSSVNFNNNSGAKQKKKRQQQEDAVAIKQEPMDEEAAGGVGEDTSTQVLSKRWMCNVCRKLHVTHMASLAHIATHTDTSFIPRSILKDVIISRKSLSVVSASRANDCDTTTTSGSLSSVMRADSSSNTAAGSLGSTTSTPSRTGKTWQQNYPASSTGASLIRAISRSLKDFTDISYPVISRSYISNVDTQQPATSSVNIEDDDGGRYLSQQQQQEEEQGQEEVAAKPSYLEDNVAYNISKTNNLQWRNNSVPYQSMDQKNALERSIDKLYSRQKSSSEPRLHEILWKRRLELKPKTVIVEDCHNVEDTDIIVVKDETLSVATTDYFTENKRKGDEDSNNGSPNKRRRPGDEDVNYTDDSVAEESLEGDSEVYEEVTVDDTASSPDKDTAPADQTQSKLWSMFADDWDDDDIIEVKMEEDSDLLPPAAAVTETVLAEDLTGSPPPDTTTSIAQDTDNYSSQSPDKIDDAIATSDDNFAKSDPESIFSNGSETKMSSRDQILDEWSNSPDPEVATSSASNLIDPDIPSTRIIVVSTTSEGHLRSTSVSRPDAIVVSSSCAAPKIIQSDQKPDTGRTVDQSFESRYSVRSVRQAKPSGTTPQASEPPKLQSHFSELLQKRALNINLDRRRTQNIKVSTFSRKNSVSDLGTSSKPRFSSSAYHNTAGIVNKSNSPSSSTSSASNFSPLGKKLQSTGIHQQTQSPVTPHLTKEAEDLKLFDCGSAAEEPLCESIDLPLSLGSAAAGDATKIDAAMGDPFDQSDSRFKNAISGSPSLMEEDTQDDTVMKTASTLGLFDTGFEECRLHMEEEASTSATDSTFISNR